LAFFVVDISKYYNASKHEKTNHLPLRKTLLSFAALILVSISSCISIINDFLPYRGYPTSHTHTPTHTSTQLTPPHPRVRPHTHSPSQFCSFDFGIDFQLHQKLFLTIQGVSHLTHPHTHPHIKSTQLTPPHPRPHTWKLCIKLQ
jgi:hypothetical protein